jgi:ATP-binding cassette subfamily F protein 3
VRVVEGNYATYEHLRAQGLGGRQLPSGDVPKPAEADRRPPRSAGRPNAARKKRRFPYRKVDDLEGEICRRETRIEQLHAALADPQTLRDGDRVRQLKAEIAEQQQTLQTLYAHWDEATELNW